MKLTTQPLVAPQAKDLGPAFDFVSAPRYELPLAYVPASDLGLGPPNEIRVSQFTQQVALFAAGSGSF